MHPSRWPLIRHGRWLVLAWGYTRWWQRVGRHWWLTPNPHDLDYLDDVWKGEA